MMPAGGGVFDGEGDGDAVVDALAHGGVARAECVEEAELHEGVAVAAAVLAWRGERWEREDVADDRVFPGGRTQVASHVHGGHMEGGAAGAGGCAHVSK